uniref:RE21268p n=1 Tax=Drosophila melanogaster TaxID=7227 RepID=D3DN13_DROME|nr:RE21268p [Drosophila melanogaster]
MSDRTHYMPILFIVNSIPNYHPLPNDPIVSHPLPCMGIPEIMQIYAPVSHFLTRLTLFEIGIELNDQFYGFTLFERFAIGIRSLYIHIYIYIYIVLFSKVAHTHA